MQRRPGIRMVIAEMQKISDVLDIRRRVFLVNVKRSNGLFHFHLNWDSFININYINPIFTIRQFIDFGFYCCRQELTLCDFEQHPRTI